eukprot:TRINITY_DN14348_c0_g1_i7.p4 TRINITY_DN14348_c0_g1~~TRINITY_DN14348_c0_g1_i7.p4  ORF type:complete len:104 (+),score=38.38 TRINITY_DN14348_c0_g1_i7:73-384(+)
MCIRDSLYTGSLSKLSDERLFGILYKSQLAQVFFHVNTLLQQSTSKSFVGEVIAKDNVRIVWNESKEELSEELLRKVGGRLCVVIEEFEGEVCEVTIKNVVLE